MMAVTQHAIHRYQERVENVPDETARERLSCSAILTAIAFGAPIVRLGSGHRVVIKGGNIITVLSPLMHRKVRHRDD